jgi:hypothetical protein
MKKIYKLLFLFSAIAFTVSCKRNNNIIPATPETTVNDSETVTASVTGIVVNENNIPVQGAAVKLGNQNTTTDLYGMFRFKNISISKNNGYVKVTKAGYFNGNRSFITTAGRTHNMRIKLLPKTNTGTVNATAGGTVTLASGGKVTFPSNAIVDASGNAYSGVVNVAMTWINPTANDLGSIMQGDLRGITTAGSERVLETYGMLGVELTGASGQDLKIATGKTAELSSPIPAALQATAPATIPLWHFDESKGRWIEEGSATKVGTNYVGTVKHFSFWNYDIGALGVTLCVNVVNPNNQPLNNATVRIRRVNNPASMSYGLTDSLGNVCGAVFANEPLVLEVLTTCGTVVYTQNIGPYSSNASVNVIATIPAINTLTLSGTVVNCSNISVTNGSVLIYFGGGNFYNAVVTNGAFTVTILNCNATTVNFTAMAIDNATQQQGNPVNGTGTSGNVAIGQLTACGTSSAQYVNYIVDGVPYGLVTPTDSIVAYGGAGSGFTHFASIAARGGTFGGTVSNANNFTFNYNAILGAYPINNAFVAYNNNNISNVAQSIVSLNPQVNLTGIGPSISGFLEGNYNVDMVFSPGGVTRNVQCTFRVRRP